MASSRASTSAGRRRTARRGAHAAPQPRRSAKSSPSARGAKRPPKRSTAAGKRKQPRPSLASLLPRTRAIAGIGAIVLALLAAGYQFWFRHSSLVAVEEVTVTGIRGPEREPVEAALREAALEMTTLNADADALAAAVAAFPTVVGVEADADFPHGLAITVVERPPVLLASDGAEALPVAGDGTILRGVDAEALKLPEITTDELPADGKVTGDALEIALVIGAAPGPLRGLVEEAAIGGPEGIQLTLRGDIPLYFGGSERAAEKWAAAAAVLADRKIDQLTYLDLRVPERPAVGGAAPPVGEETTDTTEPETGPIAAAEPATTP